VHAHKDWGRRGETCEMKKKWRRLDRLAIFGDTQTLGAQTLGAKTVDSNVDVAILALFPIINSDRIWRYQSLLFEFIYTFSVSFW